MGTVIEGQKQSVQEAQPEYGLLMLELYQIANTSFPSRMHRFLL
jgi:hypothetical protein